MNPDSVTVTILGKEFHVACPEEERSGLLASAALLDKNMKDIRDQGRVVGMDRIAVIAALNLAHEMLQHRGRREALNQGLTKRLCGLQERIEEALKEGRQMEL